MKPTNLANNLSAELHDHILYDIDTPWDSQEIFKTISEADYDNLVDRLESKLENRLEFRLGDTMTNVVMEDLDNA